MAGLNTRDRIEACLGEGTRTELGYRITRVPFLAQQIDCSTLIGVVSESPEQAELLDQIIRIRRPKQGFSAWQPEIRIGGGPVALRRAEAALFIPRVMPFMVNLPHDVLLGEFFSDTDGSGSFAPVASLEDEVYGEAIVAAVRDTCARPVVDAEWAEDVCSEIARNGWRVLTELAVEPSTDHSLLQRVDELMETYQF